ncbi:unnamed protein product [marine sediment metagenome]|uniref:Molybdenum cofactor biosynthesis protein MoaE n=1 Tax=marine sediment metagenome TaxID=412755 RepID=X1MKW5_9ZZZZ
MHVEITEEDIDTSAIIENIKSSSAGGIATFTGTVRDVSGGKKVVAIEMEAYDEMALDKLKEVASQAKDKFDIVDIAIVHRVGRMEVGETIVFIAVSAAHRAPGFDAARFAIDEIKRVVPLWKREIFEDGTGEWVGGTR